MGLKIAKSSSMECEKSKTEASLRRPLNDFYAAQGNSAIPRRRPTTTLIPLLSPSRAPIKPLLKPSGFEALGEKSDLEDIPTAPLKKQVSFEDSSDERSAEPEANLEIVDEFKENGGKIWN